MSKQDTLYSNKINNIDEFRFDDLVADVFPDMINRSVPGYADIIKAAGRIARRYVSLNSNVYDFGCSLGATSLAISRALPDNHCKIEAVDNAPAMVQRCKRIVSQYALPNPIHVVCDDVSNINVNNASMVCMNFTLQFIAREKRKQILENIANGLHKEGVFLLSEKIKDNESSNNALLVELHHDYKKENGYSELEISQKRAALESVMLTDTIETHKQRLLNAGFSNVVLWYQHYNFASFLAVK